MDANLPRLSSYFYGDLPCAYWPNPTPNPERPAPLTAESVPTFVMGGTADPATPVGNGVSVFGRLADGYLFTQQGGPHVIYGRGNNCPDKAVTAFMLNGKVPSQRVSECEGVVADDYVPIAPARATAFADPKAGLASAENEIFYLPEYYYWDGVEPVSAGCPNGGTIDFAVDGDQYTFTLNACAFSQNFTMTGPGSDDPDRDRFTLDVTLTGRWRCAQKYVRTGERTKVTGACP